MDITHRTDGNSSTDVTDTHSKNVSYLHEQAECMDGEVSYKRIDLQVPKDDAFSEEELAFLRQLGIENPNEIAKERICLYGETEPKKTVIRILICLIIRLKQTILQWNIRI